MGKDLMWAIISFNFKNVFSWKKKRNEKKLLPKEQQLLGIINSYGRDVIMYISIPKKQKVNWIQKRWQKYHFSFYILGSQSIW